ncbi:MAG: type II toxin-antitoxin system HicB family antitoxin [Candidatus Ornithomonoglobus sp.]
MLTIYPACFFKEENAYSVIFPDLNYLSTCGETIDEAMTMAVDCLAGYMHTIKTDKEEIPTPSMITEINPDKISEELGFKHDGAFVSMVSVDVEEYAKLHFDATVEKTISIPAWLNDRANALGLNCSQVLQEALLSRITA